MDKQYRLTWRRERAAKTRQERVISAYVRLTQPMLYAEAMGFYNTLAKKYPNKMDLRKVPEFQELKPKSIDTSGRPFFNDNLDLRIPLLKLTTPSTSVSSTPRTASTASTSVSLTTASTASTSVSLSTASTASTSVSLSTASTASTSVPLHC